MTKDAEGTWNVTTPPAVPGFHYYWFVLDGVWNGARVANMAPRSKRLCSATVPLTI